MSLSTLVRDAVREDDTAAAASDADSDLSPIDALEPHASLSYALTPTLLEFASAIAEHETTFLQFPKSHQPFHLTRAQEDHARQLLQQCQPIAKLRFRIVPKQMKEEEFWRVYFLLMRNVAKKVIGAQREEPIAEEDPTPATNETETNDNEGTTISDPTASSVVSTPQRQPARSALDMEEIDRLCGVSNLRSNRRLSMGLTGDSDDDEYDGGLVDHRTDAVLDAIVRNHRGLNASFSLPSSPAAPILPSDRNPSLSSDFTNDNTEFNVTEAELNDALEEAAREDANSSSISDRLDTEELP